MNPNALRNSNQTSEIAIITAQPADRFALENLLQLYTYDFTEQWAGLERGELDDDGRFAEYPLDAYWQEPDHTPFLVRRAGHLIGFALLNSESHTGKPVDRNVAELFITRKHRRGSVGTYVAQALFTRYPGQWEAAVARRNTAALAFWRKAIQSHPQVTDIEEHDIDDAHWNGPVIRFFIRA
jgi:predicted acetyltransferase